MSSSSSTAAAGGCSHSPARRLAAFGLASIRATLAPRLAKATAATEPTGPPPMIAAS